MEPDDFTVALPFPPPEGVIPTQEFARQRLDPVERRLAAVRQQKADPGAPQQQVVQVDYGFLPQ